MRRCKKKTKNRKREREIGRKDKERQRQKIVKRRVREQKRKKKGKVLEGNTERDTGVKRERERD